MGTISENFSFAEFENTQYADLRIANVITSVEVRDNIIELVHNILQPLRAVYGKPLTITSGYRCPELNKRVGGSPTSAHLKGLAADIVPDSCTTQEERRAFISWAIAYLKNNGFKFDQLIEEHNSKGVYWLHIGWKNLKGEQRQQVKINFLKK